MLPPASEWVLPQPFWVMEKLRENEGSKDDRIVSRRNRGSPPSPIPVVATEPSAYFPSSTLHRLFEDSIFLVKYVISPWLLIQKLVYY